MLQYIFVSIGNHESARSCARVFNLMHSIFRPWHLVQAFIVSHTSYPDLLALLLLLLRIHFFECYSLSSFSWFIILITIHVHTRPCISIAQALFRSNKSSTIFADFIQSLLFHTYSYYYAHTHTHGLSTCCDLCGLSFDSLESRLCLLEIIYTNIIVKFFYFNHWILCWRREIGTVTLENSIQTFLWFKYFELWSEE